MVGGRQVWFWDCLTFDLQKLISDQDSSVMIVVQGGEVSSDPRFSAESLQISEETEAVFRGKKILEAKKILVDVLLNRLAPFPNGRGSDSV